MGHPLVPGKLDRQIVLGVLKATGSHDPDVLYARKQELIAEKKGAMSVVRAWGIIVAGALLTLMVIGAPVGIPALIYGVWLRSKLKKNSEIAETTFSEYMKSIGAGAGTAGAGR